MAAHTVPTGQIGKYEILLTAGVEDTVTFGGGGGDPDQQDLSYVEVKELSGTKPVYFCFGTNTATVKGGHCYDVHPGTAVIVQPGTSGDTVVHLISEAEAVVSVSNGG